MKAPFSLCWLTLALLLGTSRCQDPCACTPVPLDFYYLGLEDSSGVDLLDPSAVAYDLGAFRIYELNATGESLIFGGSLGDASGAEPQASPIDRNWLLGPIFTGGSSRERVHVVEWSAEVRDTLNLLLNEANSLGTLQVEEISVRGELRWARSSSSALEPQVVLVHDL